MKGLQEKTASNAIFLVIKHNSICQESKNERAGFEPVEVMNPQTKEVSIRFIKKYECVDALITKIEWRDTEDQYEQRYMSWKIHLDAAGTPCVLEIPFNSRVGDRFMKMAENLDFSKPVEFRAWRDNEDKTAFILRQDGVSVPQLYTKANPGACPPPVQKFGGKWNFDDQSEFLHSQMMTVVIPRVEAAVPMRGEHPSDWNERPPDGDDHAENPYSEEAPF